MPRILALLLTLLSITATINAQRPDFSDCDKIAGQINTATNRDEKLRLSMSLLDCMNNKMTLPPMPPRLKIGDGIAITNSSGWNHKPKTFTALCPHCRTKYSNLLPVNITTNGGVSTNGGTIVSRTITFGCPNRNCLENFDSKNSLFVPESIAVEDDPSPMGGSGGGTAAQSWTTDPNLVLTVTLTNCTSDAPFHAAEPNTILIAPDTGLTGSMICGPLVCVRFFTATNLLYTCQASDDGTKTWLNGLPVIGNGGPVTLCEVPLHPHRVYRVLETPL